MKPIYTDILIIGSGIAALQCARSLGPHFTVHIITKSTIYMSSSYRAQGGVAAVTTASDHVQLHINDTLEAGVHHHDMIHVESLIKGGATFIQSLIQEDLHFDKNKDGTIALGLEGNHSRHRILHAGGDQTGKMFVDYLLTQLPPSVTIQQHELAYELLLNTDGACIGLETLKDGVRTKYFAHHIVMATGGAGALYPCTSNFRTNTGNGIALAYRIGAAISDMEFMQFHPSLLYVNGEGKGLVSEAVRGEGGIFVTAERKPIMQGIHPLLDLAPRHITAHTLYTRRARGEETFIDISAISNFETHFPTITALCNEHDIDLENGLIPVIPGSHFLMGGIIADDCGRTSIKQLYAIGEVACTGVHGANRLASNSLLEAMTFGHNLARHIVTSGCNQQNFTIQTQNKRSVLPNLFTKQQLQQHMMQALGIVRDKQQIALFIEQLPTLQQLQTIELNTLPSEQIELVLMHTVATLMAHASYMRNESRGAHIRSDFSKTDMRWANEWIVFQHGQMKVRNDLYEQHQTGQHANAIF